MFVDAICFDAERGPNRFILLGQACSVRLQQLAQKNLGSSTCGAEADDDTVVAEFCVMNWKRGRISNISAISIRRIKQHSHFPKNPMSCLI